MFARPGLFASSLLVLASCASAGPAPGSPPGATTTQGSAGEKDAPADGTTTGQSTSATPKVTEKTPAVAPRPIEDAPPKGVEPLTKEEESELGSTCTAYTDAVRKKARAEAKRGMGSAEAALKALPDVAPSGPKGPRCQALLKRGLVDDIAMEREAIAIRALNQIVFGVYESFGTTKELCPTSEPVPKSIEVIQQKPYEASRTDYATPAWKCARFDTLGTPQHFQYAIEVAETQQSYRAVARGFPVDGGAAEQIFVEIFLLDGAIPPSGAVMRK